MASPVRKGISPGCALTGERVEYRRPLPCPTPPRNAPPVSRRSRDYVIPCISVKPAPGTFPKLNLTERFHNPLGIHPPRAFHVKPLKGAKISAGGAARHERNHRSAKNRGIHPPHTVHVKPLKGAKILAGGAARHERNHRSTQGKTRAPRQGRKNRPQTTNPSPPTTDSPHCIPPAPVSASKHTPPERI